jgi:choice-of-anchor A domain-containing protein
MTNSSARLIVLTSVLFLSAGTARAALFQGYDLVVFGNMAGGSDVEGSAIIGGNLTGNTTNFATQLSGQAAGNVNLFVGGNVTAGENLDNGSAVVGGTVSPYINLNQSGSTLTQNDAGATSSILGPLQTSLINASKSYAGTAQSSNAVISMTGNSTTFSQTGSASGGPVIFDIKDTSVFTQNANITLSSDLESASSVIINVDVTEANRSLTIGSSIHLTAPSALESNVIWNFYDLTPTGTYDTSDAMTLQTQTDFAGAILAPYAAFSNTTSVEGSVAVASFAQGGEIHMPLSAVVEPTSIIPEPSACGLLVIGAVGAMVRRRRK